METIKNVSISELHSFRNHPFKVETNTELCELMRSIEKEGVLVPLMVRTNPYGDGYEVISGHRRKEAALWAGETEVPVVIRELDDDQAVVAMVDSNLHRENLKPSEKAFAYRMKLEAMKHQGKKVSAEDITLAQVEPRFAQKEQGDVVSGTMRSNELLAKQAGESVAQIKRYIRLTNLIPKILDMVDQGKIAFTVAVELSYLKEEELVVAMWNLETMHFHTVKILWVWKSRVCYLILGIMRSMSVRLSWLSAIMVEVITRKVLKM